MGLPIKYMLQKIQEMKADDLDYYAAPTIKEKKVKPKYKLIVKDAGNYAEDSLIKLIWTVLKHRLHHLYNGEGWRD